MNNIEVIGVLSYMKAGTTGKELEALDFAIEAIKEVRRAYADAYAAGSADGYAAGKEAGKEEGRKEAKDDNAALHLLVDWAIQCNFGYDNFPEEYEEYKDELESQQLGYKEGMIYIADKVVKREGRR